MPAGVDIGALATGLERRSDGIWFAREREEVSYPKRGHGECYGVEAGSFWFAHRNACILAAMARFPPAGPVFDVGGGNGVVSQAIRAAGMEAVLVEPGIEGVMHARERGLPTLVCATLEQAGFRAHTLPAVGLFDVLEHIDDDLGALRTVHRLLVPGGLLYLTVPAYPALWSVEDVASGHKRRYTRRGLARGLDAAGFDAAFAGYVFAFLPLPVWLFRTVPSRLGLRTARDAARNAREHRSGRGSALLKPLMALEARRVAAGRGMPFGGSCLVVARARDGRP